MGIDLVAKKGDDYFAVQSKWKNPYKKGTIPGTVKLKHEKVNWNELCTFLVLCERSGPWKHYIVMTNGVGIRRVGRRSKKDKSICLKTFQSIPLGTWYDIADFKGEVLGRDDEIDEDETLNEKRLKFFTNQQKEEA